MAAPNVYPPQEGAKFVEDFQSVNRYQPSGNMNPETPAAATGVSDGEAPQRSGTLKKKNSVKRSGSKRSRTGSVRSFNLGEPDSRNSLYYSPVPAGNNPTEVLVNRFQAWRNVLKDFIAYFREVQSQYENRGRGISKITQTLNAATRPNNFVARGGILETNTVLSDFHKEAAINAQNAAKIEMEVINTLTCLRSDLNAKIKEIKALSGDFKSNVEKEKEASKREVLKLKEAIEAFDSNPTAGKDPYIVKLGVEKQLKHHIGEENYLHKAYLNLESSGRELEKIIVGEIQKAYDTYAKIIAREGQELVDLSERLTASTLRLPTDYEWSAFVERDPHMVNPSIPMRTVEEIEYPGHKHPSAVEVRTGMLERKSKYLKSFTPAWYVLSATHLHEFKSPDRRRDPTPVMSLYLPESTLGKYSDPAAVSHKFVLKARQTGALHRGHSWVFRAESHQAMLEWYEAIKKLTEVSGAERNAYVQSATSHQNHVQYVQQDPEREVRETHEAEEIEKSHRRTISGRSHRADSFSSDNGLDNDEADEIPYTGQTSELDYSASYAEEPQRLRRPEAGRFPSDMQINRGGYRPSSLSGGSSSSVIAAANGLPGTNFPGDRCRNEAMGRDPAYMVDGAGYDHEPHDIERNYIVVPPVHQKLPDSPTSWSSNERIPVRPDETPGFTAMGSPISTRLIMTTGYGIDPITGEHETQPPESSHHLGDRHIAFLGSEEPMRGTPLLIHDSPVADPREPIPAHEAGPVALDSGSLDAVAVAPPYGDSPTSPAKTLNAIVEDNTSPATAGAYGDSDRPHIHRDNSNTTIGQGTISDLPMPGKYPKK